MRLEAPAGLGGRGRGGLAASARAALGAIALGCPSAWAFRIQGITNTGNTDASGSLLGNPHAQPRKWVRTGNKTASVLIERWRSISNKSNVTAGKVLAQAAGKAKRKWRSKGGRRKTGGNIVVAGGANEEDAEGTGVDEEEGADDDSEQEEESLDAASADGADRVGESPARRRKGENTQEATYRVLTYNICWGCMEADANDKTGMRRQLAKDCMQIVSRMGHKGENGMGFRTKCADNTGDAIARFHKDVKGYDLIALQEASNYAALRLPSRGVRMRAVEFGTSLGFPHASGIHKGKPKKAWVVSLYNQDRFGWHSKKLEGNERSELGRPYLILIFDAPRLVFINVHHVHRGSSFRNFTYEIQEKLQSAFEELPDRRSYRVIMAGDFNDEHGQLQNIRIPWSVATLQLKPPVVKTCCTTAKGYFPQEYGDYIFDSAGPVATRLPPSFTNDLPKSDHWPVEADLGPGANGTTTLTAPPKVAEAGKRKKLPAKAKAKVKAKATVKAFAKGAALLRWPGAKRKAGGRASLRPRPRSSREMLMQLPK